MGGHPLLEYASASADTAQLTATNGDVYEVQFAAPAVRVETSFGKTELPVNLIRSIQVSAIGKLGQLPSGLVALWSGEGDGNDSVGGNTATLTDISFAEGKVGHAFALNGFSSYLEVANNLSSNLAQGEGLTISAWIKPSDISGLHPILNWQNYATPTPYGVSLRIGHQPGDQGVIYGNFFDAGNNSHELVSSQGIVVNNIFQYVALTYDKSSGQVLLYLNGVVVAQDQLHSPVPFNLTISEI